MALSRRTSIRLIKILFPVLACLFYAVVRMSTAQTLSPRPELGRWRAGSGHDPPRPDLLQTVVDGRLYMPASTNVSFAGDAGNAVPLERLRADLAIAPGGFARLFFGHDGTTYTSFCVSLNRDVPSGFYRHRPGRPSRLIAAADLPEMAEWPAGERAFPDEKYNTLELNSRDRMPVEMLRDETFVSVSAEIRREGDRLTAYVNGRPVAAATLDGWDAAPRRGAGVISGIFPGCYLKSVSLSDAEILTFNPRGGGWGRRGSFFSGWLPRSR